MKDLFVIVPVFNEETEVLKHTLSGIFTYFNNVVVVNDGWKRGLFKELKGFPIHYLRHEINLGQGASLQTGMEYALKKGAKQIAFFDADGQHCPKDLLKLVSILQEEKCGMVMGSRFLNRNSSTGMPLIRKIILKAGIYLNFIFTGVLLSDAHNGLKVLNEDVAYCIDFKHNRQLHATELLWIIKKYKIKYKEAPVSIKYTDYSLKKGQKNSQVFKIFSDLVFSKFIR